jgi:hypothetical protein
MLDILIGYSTTYEQIEQSSICTPDCSRLKSKYSSYSLAQSVFSVHWEERWMHKARSM